MVRGESGDVISKTTLDAIRSTASNVQSLQKRAYSEFLSLDELISHYFYKEYFKESRYGEKGYVTFIQSKPQTPGLYIEIDSLTGDIITCMETVSTAPVNISRVNDPEFLYEYANLLICVFKRAADAEKYYTKAALMPATATLKNKNFNNFGFTLIYLKKFQAAIKIFQQISDRKDDRALLGIGFCYLQLEKFPEAIVFLTQAININPTQQLYYLRAVAYINSGEIVKAQQDIELCAAFGGDAELTGQFEKLIKMTTNGIVKPASELEASGGFDWSSYPKKGP